VTKKIVKSKAVVANRRPASSPDRTRDEWRLQESLLQHRYAGNEHHLHCEFSKERFGRLESKLTIDEREIRTYDDLCRFLVSVASTIRFSRI
jgi:hypothetical protein